MANGNSDVKSHSELMELCEEEGLQKSISDNQLDGKKVGNLLGIRRTCLMESLGQLLTDSILGSLSDIQLLTLEIRERAKAIATDWKPKLDDLDFNASSGNSLEAHASLQLLATVGIDSEFDQDELCKLIPVVTNAKISIEKNDSNFILALYQTPFGQSKMDALGKFIDTNQQTPKLHTHQGSSPSTKSWMLLGANGILKKKHNATKPDCTDWQQLEDRECWKRHFLKHLKMHTRN